MNNQNFTTAILVNQTPTEVFNAISNVREWWSQSIDGETGKPGAVFYYHYLDIHRCTFKISEFVPGKKIVWHVLQNYFNFIKEKTEWTDTDVVFEIAESDGKTELRFTHIGLLPEHECYGVCSDSWGRYITGSLRDLITTGKGQPNPIEEVVASVREIRAGSC